MANSKLLGKEFGVPPELQKITGNPTISYSMLKHFKNFFDYNDSSHPYYEKKGGDRMKSFVDATLRSQRSRVHKSSELKSEFSTENGFKKTHNKNRQTKNVTDVGGVPKIHKSTTSKHIYNDEVLYEQIIRIQELINHKSIL